MSKLADRLTPLGQLRGLRDVALFVRVAGVAAAVPLLVRLPLPRLAAVLSPPRRKAQSVTFPAVEAERILRCVESSQQVGSPLVRRGCLTRGITLYWFLHRAGADVSLCFGLGRVGEGLTGHCWLIRDGQPYLEDDNRGPCFEPIYQIPSPGQ